METETMDRDVLIKADKHETLIYARKINRPDPAGF